MTEHKTPMTQNSKLSPKGFDISNSSEDNDDDLYEHYAFIASKGQEPLRVDKFLMNFIENATRNKIQKAAKEGNIYVNDVVVKQNYKVKN